jgi:hypothetical protein
LASPALRAGQVEGERISWRKREKMPKMLQLLPWSQNVRPCKRKTQAVKTSHEKEALTSPEELK